MKVLFHFLGGDEFRMADAYKQKNHVVNVQQGPNFNFTEDLLAW